MKESCESENPDCKYFPDCFSDAHHLYGRPKSGTAKKFARLACNTVQLCRAEHDELHATEGVLPLPDLQTMKNALSRRPNS